MPRIKVHHTGGEVMAQVQAYARALGLVLERRNTGAARYRNADGTERLVRFGRPGDPDLSGLIEFGPHRGKTILIEAKATGELPTMAQFDRIVRTNQAGGLAFWADSLDTAMAVLPRVLAGARIQYIDMTRAEIYDKSEIGS